MKQKSEYAIIKFGQFSDFARDIAQELSKTTVDVELAQLIGNVDYETNYKNIIPKAISMEDAFNLF